MPAQHKGKHNKSGAASNENNPYHNIINVDFNGLTEQLGRFKRGKDGLIIAEIILQYIHADR